MVKICTSRRLTFYMFMCDLFYILFLTIRETIENLQIMNILTFGKHLSELNNIEDS